MVARKDRPTITRQVHRHELFLEAKENMAGRGHRVQAPGWGIHVRAYDPSLGTRRLRRSIIRDAARNSFRELRAHLITKSDGVGKAERK